MESMTAGPPLSFDLVDQALENVNSVAGAPEAHGGLCGMACVFGKRAAAIWVAELSDELSHANPDRPESGDVLGQLANVTCQGLSEGDMSFTLLLPPDDRPIADRAGALADWCTGFMNGLGQAAADRGSFNLTANELAREILENFSEIARATPGERRVRG